MLMIIIIALFCIQSIQPIIRETSFPFISGDSFRAIADHLFDETHQCKSEEIKYKDIIFVKTDMLDQFFAKVHPTIKCKYFLISHNSDYSAPSKFEYMLNDEKILMWFGQNPTIMNHSKFIPIPIGIANRYCIPHGNIDTFTAVLKGIRYNNNKQYLLGINFRVGTNANVRQLVHNYFSALSFCNNLFSENHELYLRNMSKAKFIISPRGNGLDCHRIWEALLVGSVPIIQSSTLDELLQDLPVIIVDDWSQITKHYLEEQYEFICNNFFSFNLGKIYLPYWIQLIQYYRHKCN